MEWPNRTARSYCLRPGLCLATGRQLVIRNIQESTEISTSPRPLYKYRLQVGCSNRPLLHPRSSVSNKVSGIGLKVHPPAKGTVLARPPLIYSLRQTLAILIPMRLQDTAWSAQTLFTPIIRITKCHQIRDTFRLQGRRQSWRGQAALRALWLRHRTLTYQWPLQTSPLELQNSNLLQALILDSPRQLSTRRRVPCSAPVQCSSWLPRSIKT